MSIPSLDDLLRDGAGLRGQRVFVRADLNVPLDGSRVTDDTRVRAAIPTLRKLLAAGARVILASHLGRPKGKRDPSFSLVPVVQVLSELLGRKVRFCDTCRGDAAQIASRELSDGELLLLENLRFEADEEANDPAFAKELAGLCEVYVNDAFGTAHRAHASTAGIANHVSRKAAGDLMTAELAHLASVKDPKRPLLCLLGGAKVSDKLPVLEALAPHADTLAIGGAMAYTFLLAQGLPTGKSLVESDRVEDARRVLAAAEAAGRRILLPTDHVVVSEVAADAPTRTVAEIPPDLLAVDIGPATAAAYAAEVQKAETIFWNGPMGIFEIPAFSEGTRAVARAVAEGSGRSVVGGGDSLAAVNAVGVGERIDHLSTGGGASLEFVQGKVLPGVAALGDD